MNGSSTPNAEIKESKGVHDLLGAWPAVLQKVPAARLVLDDPVSAPVRESSQ